MKRRGYIISDLCEFDNLEQGYQNSKRGKTYIHNSRINKTFDKQKTLDKLQQDFLKGTYKTSDYTVFKVYEPKERIIYRLPYDHDRIAHHVIMNTMEQFWINHIPNTSFSCIKGRGIMGAYKYLRKCLKDVENTQYCLQMDVRKFFPSINHEILKNIIAKHIKDKDFLKIINEIIDSTDRHVISSGIGKVGYGVPIGNYLSQFFANLYLTPLYDAITNKFKVKMLIYMDDMVILAKDKSTLHKIRRFAQNFLKYKLDLQLKSNWQIYNVDIRGINFVGYVYYHTHTLLRNKTKLKIFRIINKYKHNEITLDDLKTQLIAYYGWLKYCNSKYLLQKIEKDTTLSYSNFVGKIRKISTMKYKNIRLIHIDKHDKYFCIQAIYKFNPIIIKSTNRTLYANISHNIQSFTLC